ncbi:phage tail protein [Qipengyuania marisflavi]|uniref:Phage tail protein n=2 Tax=Qipengyuania marisflavi TaxID=2486356 RepID=A0A5S3PRF4_9SPHN|nr:phage tail protein [Qipengyuania marisflavi]
MAGAMAGGVAQPAHAGDDPFIGQITNYGFNFCPRGWAAANGAILPISSNTALFSLYGTTFGGDGRTTFQLPDLRGRVPLGDGRGPGLSDIRLGEQGGLETVTLTAPELPSHTHALNGSLSLRTSTSAPDTNDPNGAALATFPSDRNIYSTSARDRPGMPVVGQITLANTGGGQAHENRPPFLVMNWCVAIQGTYPSRS